MADVMQAASVNLGAEIFRCPRCHAPLAAAGKCGSCGFEVMSFEGIPVLLADPQAVAETIAKAKAQGRASWYEDPHATQLEGPYRHHLRRRRAYLDRVLGEFTATAKRPLRALDMGCGDGLHLAWLGGYADEVWGSDYNLLRLTRAAKSGHAGRLFLADVTNYPARDEVFDIVFFNHVIEHIPDDRKALAEARRVLKKDGILILGTPNEGAFFWQLAYRLQPETLRTSDHVHFYTVETLAERCREAGLSVRAVERLGWGIPHWSLDARLRQFKVVDDLFEVLGPRLLPGQATSLYFVLGKQP